MNAASRLVTRLRRSGGRDLAQRAVRRLTRGMGLEELDFPLLPHDISDSTRLELQPRVPMSSADGARIGWVCTPADAGSGGHTTMFRMVRSLVDAGHPCTLFLYDRHGADFGTRVEIIRRAWPWLEVDFRDAERGIDGVDACVATSWETAHVLARHGTAPMARLYFAQDYEPLFHPRGTLSALAEDSYRFGFRVMALGAMVADHVSALADRVDVVPFGCDTETYTLTNPDGPRSGVVFYAKPSSDRRGYLLGRRALEIFHARHPEQPIHLYGETIGDWDIPVIQHGRVSPEELAALYNTTLAGIVLSFTNISLIPEELLACGAVAVVNDSADARAVLTHPDARWCLATPGAIADALSAVVENPDPELPRRATRLTAQGWGPTADAVGRVIRDELTRGSAARHAHPVAAHIHAPQRIQQHALRQETLQ